MAKKRYVITDPDILQKECIRNQWFTCGGSRQYDLMFEANKVGSGYTIEDIAMIIWVCSDTDRVFHIDILNKLNKLYDEYGERIYQANLAEREDITIREGK